MWSFGAAVRSPQETPATAASNVTILNRLLLIALLALLAPAAAAASPYTAPGGKVLWGGQGGYDAAHIRAFEQQSGKHPAVFNYFISWKASEFSNARPI